tara:strand:- start:19065 stop:19985 length:921 start_codon:yes stop_codon:yes gene_type:complete
VNILIFGSNGLVGSSLVRRFEANNKQINLIKSTRKDTNLFSLEETKKKIEESNPDIVIIAAAKVGGIYANNTQRFNFIIDNLKISMNIFESLIEYNETKIINIGSSCIYPLNANNPINENSLMTGKLEPTNSPYSMAKLSSLEISRTMKDQFGHNILNLMPTNLYGPNDKFEEFHSHVIPGLIFKMHRAKEAQSKEVDIWGSGKPLREFMHVDDLSLAIEFLIKNDCKHDILNVGSSEIISIEELSNLIKKIVGFKGDLIFNNEYPDGNPKKVLDSSLINKLGWKSSISLEKGLIDTYQWYITNLN